MGIITQSVTPGSTAQTPLYLAVTVTQPPSAQNQPATDWWLADTTASLEPTHKALDLVNAPWLSSSGVPIVISPSRTRASGMGFSRAPPKADGRP